MTVTGDPNAGYSAWLLEHFSEEERGDPDLVGAGRDPGGYDIPNLLRYAFALDPREPDAAALPSLTLESSGTGDEMYLVLSYTKPIEASDLSYEVLSSADLENWEASGDDFVREALPEDGGMTERIRWRHRAAMTETEHRFLHVQVEWSEQ